MLKNTNFKIGEKIRAYDFEPIEGRPDMYVEGIIIGIEPNNYYKIKVTKDTSNLQRIHVLVPIRILISDWNGRITKIGNNHNVPQHSWINPHLSIV